MQSEIAQFEPGIFAAADAAIEAARQDLGFMILNAEAFAHAPKKSIDYAVMEKTDKAALIPADIGWSDVGTWRAVWELSDRDETGNSVRGQGASHTDQDVANRDLDDISGRIRSGSSSTLSGTNAGDATSSFDADKRPRRKRRRQSRFASASRHSVSARDMGYHGVQRQTLGAIRLSAYVAGCRGGSVRFGVGEQIGQGRSSASVRARSQAVPFTVLLSKKAVEQP
jgi:hypothetical protein